MRPKRQKVALAFLGSVLLHGIALLLFGLYVAFNPAAPAQQPENEPPTLEVVQEEPPDTPPILPDAPIPTPTPAPTVKQLVEAAGPDETDSPPPADAALSDRNTRATSIAAGKNTKPGPSQAGQKLMSFQFDPRPPAPGIVGRPEQATPAPVPSTAPELPKADRFAVRPASTPPRLATPAPTADPDEFAAAMATPTPKPEDPFDPSFRSTTPPLPKPAPKPVARSTPAPPTGSFRSAEDGGAADRGTGGINTAATPSGRYGRQVSDMIKFIWNRSADQHGESYGTVVIHCAIDRDGLVIGPRIVTNTSDTVFASTALQAVVVARLPAMPEDMIKELGGKPFTLDIIFKSTPFDDGH